MTSKRYHYLTVIERYGSTKAKKALWRCKCDCGNETIVTTGELNSGHTKSCGCYNASRLGKLKKKYNEYDLSGEFGIGISSNNDLKFYFDLEDYDKIKDYCWSVDKKNGYVDCKNEHIRLHRLVMNVADSKLYVDHINHNTSDNRKCNLRIVTASQNEMNKTPLNGEISGISYHTRDHRWQAYIIKDGKHHYLGYFGTKEEAIEARLDAEEKLYGEYSYKNSMNKGELINV